jgi:hypothetical protein
VLVLAVGIGATSILFSLIDATLPRPLAYRDPAQLFRRSAIRLSDDRASSIVAHRSRRRSLYVRECNRR